VEISAPDGQRVICQQLVPVHVPSHAVCLLIYCALLLAFAAYTIILWITEEPTTAFSTEPTSNFAPTSLTVTVNCDACLDSGVRRWLVTTDYEGYDHCDGLGKTSVEDTAVNSVYMCRTTDDITDSTGLRVRLERVSEALRVSEGRPSVVISGDGDFSVSTPLEPWHEKTLLLGLEVRRDADGCASTSDCDLKASLYLASMQYDGKVTWEGDGWGGAQLNVRLLRFAQVYTTYHRSLFEVLSGIGGASTLLIGVLGALRKLTEVVFFGAGDRESIQDAVKAVGLEVGGTAAA